MSKALAAPSKRCVQPDGRVAPARPDLGIKWRRARLAPAERLETFARPNFGLAGRAPARKLAPPTPLTHQCVGRRPSSRKRARIWLDFW